MHLDRRVPVFHRLLILVLGAALLLAPRFASAYGVSGVGARMGYADPDALDGTTTMSVHADLERSGTRVHLMPNMAFWSVNQVSNVNPNLDIYYHFERHRRVSPYLGGGMGLNFRHNDRLNRSETDPGVNLLGGLLFPGGGAARRYYLEGRFTASDVNQVALLTGVTFGSSR